MEPKTMMTKEEAIAWIRENWAVGKPIDERATLSKDGWEICVLGSQGGEVWLHGYPDGTMFLRAILPDRSGFARLTSGDGWCSKEPFDQDKVAKAMDAICRRRKGRKEGGPYEQLKLF